MMAENQRICSVDGCGKTARHKGMCRKHYETVGKPFVGCKAAGCDKQANGMGGARGFCAMHYQRWKANGDPSVVQRTATLRGVVCSVDGCGKGAASLGLCEMHYQRQKKHGDVNRGHQRQSWLEAHRDYLGDDCLTWPFSVSGHGRGTATLDGKKMSAPRAMCILAHGEPPTEQHHAAHSCGNGHLGCMSPRHLSWKLPAENEADKIKHGTLRRGRAINTNKLTERQVSEIRAAADASGVALAERYGVTPSAISAIRHRQTWAWLD